MKKMSSSLLILFSTFFILLFCHAHPIDWQNHRYIEVTVQPGDTLWSIAQKHNHSQKDVRAIIYQIQEVNHLPSVSLFPWQTLKIPIRT